MTWTKQSAYTGDLHIGCLNCAAGNGLLDMQGAAPNERLAPLDMWIAVGFGSAYVSRDDEIVFDEFTAERGWQPQRVGKQGRVCIYADPDDWCWDVARAEAVAAADPDHDWRIVKEGPLHGEAYQRHGPNRWVLIDSNMGFA